MASYNDGLSTIYDIMEQKDQLWLFMASSDDLKGTRCCISSSQYRIQKEACDWLYVNWKNLVFLCWNENNWQVHIL